MAEILTALSALSLYSIISVFLYILPGWTIMTQLWQGERLSWAELLGLSAGISAALYPLLLFTCYLLRIQVGALLAWIPGGLALGVLLWRGRRSMIVRHSLRDLLVKPARDGDRLVVGFTGFLLLLLIITRFLPISSMIAPAWGDSVHHTFIVQLLLDHGGLFQSWAPYAPIRSFTYHFGFHASAAAWAWLTGVSAPQSVILAGQAFNLFAVLALYPLAVRLSGGNWWAGACTVLVAGLLTSMPAYYVNWGRYTQLAGQVILPVLFWLFDAWWTPSRRPGLQILVLIGLCAAGLVLTHYRIVALAAAGGAVWAGWGLWVHRQRLGEWGRRLGWLLGTSLVVILAVIPWFLLVQRGLLDDEATVIVQQERSDLPFWSDIGQWQGIGVHYPAWLWVGALLCAALAIWRRPHLGIPLVFWCGLTFLFTNPFLLNLPGTGYITNFLLVIGLYIPISLFLGWAGGEMVVFLQQWQGASIFSILLLAILSVWGARQRLNTVDPFFQMVTSSDVAAFQWIEENVPRDARFVVNAFPAYSDTSVVGSDAGWWLPLYTRRESTLPPILGFVEKLAPGFKRENFLRFVMDLRAEGSDPEKRFALLCQEEVTHAFVGQRQGQVGYGETVLLPQEWFADGNVFSLLYRNKDAQVWKFNRSVCVD